MSDPADIPDRGQIPLVLGAPRWSAFSARERLCIEKRLSDPLKSGSQIGREVGVRGAQVREIFKKPAVAAFLHGFLDLYGATLEDSARVIGAAHGAEQVKVFAYKGEIVEDAPRPDHEIRLRGAELNLRVRGKLKEGGEVNINLYGELSDAQLAQLALGQKSLADFAATPVLPAEEN